MTFLDAGGRPGADGPGGTTATSGLSRRLSWRAPNLVWRRLPWWGELLTILVGYLLYGQMRVAAPEKESVAHFHAGQVWDIQVMLNLDMEPTINQFVAGWDLLAEATGYFYGTFHFVVTPAVLIWLWLRRPQAYPRLRSAVVFTTVAALAVYWLWPLAPPRFAEPWAVDVLAERDILGAADPTGISEMVNLYAAMPSLHCAWAIWCAYAVYTCTSGRWRALVWLYPVATTFVVMGTGNHYFLDAVGGAAVVALGLYLTRGSRPGAPGESSSVAEETEPGEGSVTDVRRSVSARDTSAER